MLMKNLQGLLLYWGALFDSGDSNTKSDVAPFAGALQVVRAVAGYEELSAAERLAPARSMSCYWLLGSVLLALWVGLPSATALQLLSSNQLVFVNVDHAPMGVCSTMAYGHKGDVCGVG